MLPTLIVVGALFLLWVLVNLKTSRSDGTLVKNVPQYRIMLGHILPTRNESVVYFDDYIRAEKLLEYLKQAKEKFNVDVTHALVGAVSRTMAENPKMNQFVMGRRLYKRKGCHLSFSMKRVAMNKEAKLAAVKLEMKDGEDFESLCGRIDGDIKTERSGEKTYSDKEFDLFLKIPRAVLVKAVRLFFWLDYHNLLPGSFIKNDAMYTSMFIANLGSVQMGPGYHHLYEWGNCPLFMMAGRIEDKAMVEDGELVSRKILHVRYSFDERVEDGLTASYGIATVRRILEDPFNSLGCLAEDGSDRPAIYKSTD
ncbi:MAG: hypothetical protein AUK47_24890 [Deltaproteobacteria bacterium CG2_30_63_29]|nr:MAG: hypothetical protein AUK47_24890 [Deltaproteobacteria bacterium CG2_30_63_29]